MKNLSNINLFKYTNERGESDFIFSICTNERPPVYRYFTFQEENNEPKLIRISNIMDFLSEGKQISESIPIASPEYAIFINKISELNKKLFKFNDFTKQADIILAIETLNNQNNQSSPTLKNKR